MKPSLVLWIGLVALTALVGCRKSVQLSGGMAPTVKPGEQIIINYVAYVASGPRRWDVIAFEPPSSTNAVIKRVFALPGETISLTTNGVTVNGMPMTLPTALSNVVSFPLNKLPLVGGGGVIFPYKVPSKQYFVIGDNWSNSFDSRQYGGVPITNIFGRVLHK